MGRPNTRGTDQLAFGSIREEKGGHTGLHEAAHHVRVHHERHRDAQTLARQAGDDDGYGRRVGLRVGDDGGDGTRQHNGEDGQNPRRHHGGEGEAVGGKDVAVLAHGKHESDDDVQPEGGVHGPHQRRVVLGDGVALRAGNERGDRQEEGREEEALAFVGQGPGKVSLVEQEPRDHEAAQAGEDDDVEDVDKEADLPQAGELVRLSEDEQRKTAGTHRERKPGPGEVVQALLEAQLGSVRVEDVDVVTIMALLEVIVTPLAVLQRRCRRVDLRLRHTQATPLLVHRVVVHHHRLLGKLLRLHGVTRMRRLLLLLLLLLPLLLV